MNASMNPRTVRSTNNARKRTSPTPIKQSKYFSSNIEVDGGNDGNRRKRSKMTKTSSTPASDQVFGLTFTLKNVGNVVVCANKTSVLSVDFGNQMGSSVKALESEECALKCPLLSIARQQLEEYMDGKRTKFTFPMDTEDPQGLGKGTEFQKNVWKELLKIPYGETISYAELAQRVGNPAASRAVGNANGKNPIAICVPCHRVVASNGGYAGGLRIKEKLLKLEREHKSSLKD